MPAATGKRAISIEVFYARIRGSVHGCAMRARVKSGNRKRSGAPCVISRSRASSTAAWKASHSANPFVVAQSRAIRFGQFPAAAVMTT